ncbi:hypothetical protein ACWGBV_01470 [Streptomyces sp. NPDC055051]|uniref:hypothetical protein n=1 Tax=Streptomyces sp. NPDC014861 TaxID=3364923 RepID=UPI0036FFACF9
MVEWKPMGGGPRPVPDPVATPSVWVATSAAALALVTALNFLDHHGDPALDLAVLSLIAALAGTGARLIAAPGTALLCWVALNGFAIPPVGRLTWTATHDAGRLACLLAAAVTGTVLARLLHARAAYRRVTRP